MPVASIPSKGSFARIEGTGQVCFLYSQLVEELYGNVCQIFVSLLHHLALIVLLNIFLSSTAIKHEHSDASPD